MWLVNVLKRRAVAFPTIVDPWFHAGDTYVGDYRQKIDEIAEQVGSFLDCRVRTRFNDDRRCAELVADGEVVARVRVNGECGSPYEAIVKTNLAADVRAVFENLLPVRVEFQLLDAW